MTTKRSGTAQLHKNRCERCGLRAWDDLYSDDGLPGHEILICSSCRRELEFDREFVPNCDTEGS